MRVTNCCLLGIVYLLLLTSCSIRELHPYDMVRWYQNESNGFRKSKTFGTTIIEIQKTPSNFLVAQQILGGDIPEEEAIIHKKQYKGMTYFTMVIKDTESVDPLKRGITTVEAYNQKINQLAFKTRNNVWLEMESGEKISCALAHLERTYGLTNHHVISMAFEYHEDSLSNETLVISDHVLGVGMIKFKFNKRQEPQLKVIGR